MLDSFSIKIDFRRFENQYILELNLSERGSYVDTKIFRGQIGRPEIPQKWLGNLESLSQNIPEKEAADFLVTPLNQVVTSLVR